MAERLRKGMWVKHGAQVGIVADLRDASVLFHVTDETGITSSETVVNADEVSQAAFADIPGARRPEPDAARALGYL